MTFISPEEAVKITRTEDDTKRKRGRQTKTTIEPIIGRQVDSDELLDDVKPEWKKAKKDIREISTVLPVASFVKEKKTINVIGPQITPMMVEFFHKYLEEHASIKRIAVIGFNSGTCPRPASFAGYTTETFLTARDDIEVVAFDPLRIGYVGLCARFISERYHKRFLLLGGVVSESITLFASFLGQKRFDMIYIDSGSYPHTASITSHKE